MANSRQTRKKRVLKKRYKVLIALLLIIALTIGGYFVYLYVQAKQSASEAHDGMEYEKSDLRDEDIDPKLDNFSMLLMGIDSSETRGSDDEARTDALMVATFNKEHKSVKLLSIPRDSLVDIPDYEDLDGEEQEGYATKINHAHAMGGPSLTVDTVEETLDIPIDYYARVNFDAFMDVIDVLDGIDFDVPYDFEEQDSSDKADTIALQKGEQTLDGEEALALARTRKMDSDMERGKRQQEIVQAIADKTLSAKSVLKYGDLMNAVGSNMKTNMEFKDMKSFFGYLTKGTNIDIDALNIDGTDYNPTGTYYWKLDERSLALNSNILQKHLDIDVKDYGYDFSDDELEGKTDGSNEEGKEDEIQQEDPEPDDQPENQPENIQPEEQPQEDNGQEQQEQEQDPNQEQEQQEEQPQENQQQQEEQPQQGQGQEEQQQQNDGQGQAQEQPQQEQEQQNQGQG